MDDIKNKIEDWFSEVIQSCLLWSQANKKWTAATVILLVVSFGVGSYVAWPALMGVLAAQREFLGALFASQRSISLTDNTAGAAAPAAKDCPFETSEAPTHEKVIFNEIAWMGNKESANNEWIELKNISSDVIDIAGWNLVNKNEKIRVIFHTSAKIPVGGFDLLERDGKAEDFFTGSLKNNGDSFRLFDRDCNLIDQILGATGWPAGDNKTKKTMERSSATLTWHTSSVAGGTPKKENSVSAPKPQSAVLQIIPTAKHEFVRNESVIPQRNKFFALRAY